MIFSLSLILLALFIILSWYSLETSILLVCALLPSYLIRFSIFTIPTTFLEIMILIIGIAWIIKKKMNHSSFKPWGEQASFFLISLLILATIGIVISPDKYAAIGVWKAYYLEPILFFFIIRDTVQSKEQINRLFTALGLSALFLSLFGLIQFIFRIGLPSP